MGNDGSGAGVSARSVLHLLQLKEELPVMAGPHSRQARAASGFLIVEAAMVMPFHALLGLSLLLRAIAQQALAVV